MNGLCRPGTRPPTIVEASTNGRRRLPAKWPALPRRPVAPPHRPVRHPRPPTVSAHRLVPHPHRPGASRTGRVSAGGRARRSGGVCGVWAGLGLGRGRVGPPWGRVASASTTTPLGGSGLSFEWGWDDEGSSPVGVNCRFVTGHPSPVARHRHPPSVTRRQSPAVSQPPPSAGRRAAAVTPGGPFRAPSSGARGAVCARHFTSEPGCSRKSDQCGQPGSDIRGEME